VSRYGYGPSEFDPRWRMPQFRWRGYLIQNLMVKLHKRNVCPCGNFLARYPANTISKLRAVLLVGESSGENPDIRTQEFERATVREGDLPSNRSHSQVLEAVKGGDQPEPANQYSVTISFHAHLRVDTSAG